MVLMIKKGGLAGWIRAYTIRGCATRRRRSWRHQGSIEVGGRRAPVRQSVRPFLLSAAWPPEPSLCDKFTNVLYSKRDIIIYRSA